MNWVKATIAGGSDTVKINMDNVTRIVEHAGGGGTVTTVYQTDGTSVQTQENSDALTDAASAFVRQA